MASCNTEVFISNLRKSKLQVTTYAFEDGKDFQFLAPYCKQDIEVLENVQRRTMESGAQEQLGVLGMLSLKKKGDLITLYNHLKRGWSQVGVGFSPR